MSLGFLANCKQCKEKKLDFIQKLGNVAQILPKGDRFQKYHWQKLKKKKKKKKSTTERTQLISLTICTLRISEARRSKSNINQAPNTRNNINQSTNSHYEIHQNVQIQGLCELSKNLLTNVYRSTKPNAKSGEKRGSQRD